LPHVEPPAYPTEELNGVVPANELEQYDAREVIARLVDGSRFAEFKQLYGPTVVCGFAHVHGRPVGIVANNGILFSDSSLKAAHFVELCSQRKVPLLFLQNITGFMIGKQAENEGIAKDGAKLVTAVACAQVPKFTVVVGGSYGAGNYAMCGRAYDPRFVFMWPNAKINVMGGDQAAGVLTSVTAAAMKKRGMPMSKDELEALASKVVEKFNAQSSGYFSGARMWDDGTIEPGQTRDILGLALAIATEQQPIRNTKFGVFRM